ncbi:hypothetical protein ACEQ38_21900 [Ralstonia syzygii subsp. celebesensis]|nr:hypothetical protein [Ralstonia syzygii]QQV57827.1 hypothetical protein JK151_20575 [Ralstonia syzygii subsp. celebesensis]
MISTLKDTKIEKSRWRPERHSLPTLLLKRTATQPSGDVRGLSRHQALHGAPLLRWECSPWPHPRKISRFMRTLGHAFDGNPIDLIVLESSYQYGFTHMGESVLLC